LNDVPEAGERVELAESEKVARQIAEERLQAEQERVRSGGSRRISLGDLREHMDQTGQKTLNLIVRADVQGSVEAVKGLLEETANEEVEVRVIHSGVGPITESDILLARAASAICVGFNVKPESGAKKEAERAGVEIRTYRIIYELIEDIEKAVKGMLEPKFEESYLGTVEIRAVFNLSRYGKVAGAHVLEGKITRNSKVRVRREKELVYEGQVESLKHFKEDVKEMPAGFDCGIQFAGWTDFIEGDLIEAYELVQVN
jgi:translation initiation factor IF-2